MATVIAKVKDVPAGGCISVDLPEGKVVALFNVDGHICALDGTCPHAGGPLGEGSLEGARVTCPWHGWTFDVKTGACENVPDASASIVKVSVNGEDVVLE